MTLSADETRDSSRRLWLTRLAIVAGFFAVVAPTLAWLDFFHAEENVVIATALETRRTGHWLVPTLQGRERTIKPPLTVWITAASIRPETVQHLGDHDTHIRESARRVLAFESRWATVICAGLMLVAVFELGRAIDDSSFGVLCACVCGTTWYFLVRQGSKNTVDLQLALWVNVASALLAWAVLRGRVWSGCLGAGFALGLASMSKGPAVPLLQSVVPVVLYIWWLRERPRISWAAIVLGAILMLIVGTWWYVLVYLNHPQIGPTWLAELTRKGANDLRDPWHHYLRALRFMWPWLIWFIVAIAAGFVTLIKGRRDERWMLAFFLGVVPLLVMNLFNERKERYLIPLIAPLSVMAAWVVREHIRSAPRWEIWEKIASPLHWLGLAVLVIGMPLAGAMGWEKMRTIDDTPWFSLPVAIVGGGAMLALLVAGLFAYRNHRAAIVPATVAIMSIGSLMYAWGLCRDDAGVSDMKSFAADEIWQHWPAARVYSSYAAERPGIVFMPAVDLAIYTNRTVRRVEEADNLRPGDVVLSVATRKDDAEPTSRPVNWEPVKELRRRNGEVWRLFVVK